MPEDGMVIAETLQVGDSFYQMPYGQVETYTVVRKTPKRVYINRPSISSFGTKDYPYLHHSAFCYTKASTLIERAIDNGKAGIRQWQSFISHEQARIEDLNRMLYKYQVEESRTDRKGDEI